MEKQYAPTANEKKQAKVVKQPAVAELPNESAKPAENAQKETAVEKKEVKQVQKKEEAIARGDSVRASKKHCMYIGKFIKGKSIDQAISEMGEVIKYKRAIPMKGEIPHRKGNMMSGRYPIDTAKIFISILKGLRGNVAVNGLDLSRTRIYSCSANWASRPARGGGVRAKRTHIVITARETKEDKK